MAAIMTEQTAADSHPPPVEEASGAQSRTPGRRSPPSRFRIRVASVLLAAGGASVVGLGVVAFWLSRNPEAFGAPADAADPGGFAALVVLGLVLVTAGVLGVLIRGWHFVMVVALATACFYGLAVLFAFTFENAIRAVLAAWVLVTIARAQDVFGVRESEAGGDAVPVA